MNARRRVGLAIGLLAIGLARTAQAMDIGGTIATTLTLFDDSRLVGDVTCPVVGAPSHNVRARGSP